MMRAAALAAILVLAFGLARAQELSPGDKFVGQRIGVDTLYIRQLLDENAALKAEIAKLKADAEQPKKE